MCHPFLHYSHRAVSPSDFNLLRTPIAIIAIIAIIVALKDHLALLACQSGSGREVLQHDHQHHFLHCHSKRSLSSICTALAISLMVIKTTIHH